MDLKNLSTGKEEKVFRLPPKPPLADRMYGFHQYASNLNYIDEEMKRTLPPTDCRRRPDQRKMEEGNYDVAADEKHRLEEKQRAVRKYNDKMGIEPKPLYFNEWKNPDDPDQVYYRYNDLYFEKDKKDNNWSRVPDLFGEEQLPMEVKLLGNK